MWQTKETSIAEIEQLLDDGFDVEIDSPDGWVEVEFFIDKGEWDEYVLRTENGYEVACNENHLFKTVNGWMTAKEIYDFQEIYAYNLSVNTLNGLSRAVVYYTGKKIPIVDIHVKHENHRYYTNNVESHNTGVGKTLAMCHFAASYMAAGKNVLYITMEMAEEKIAERIDANLLNTPLDELYMLPKETYDKRIAKLKEKTPGRLIVKEYPTSTAGAANFRHLLNELKIKKNFIPDVVFIDYLNICASSRMKQGANVNSYTYIKAIAEELRGLAVEFNVPIISATQTTRCLAPDTRVTLNGVATTLNNVKVGDTIESDTGNNVVTAVHKTGKQKAYKITLKNGQTVVCSSKHIFPVHGMGDVTIETGLKSGMYLQVKSR